MIGRTHWRDIVLVALGVTWSWLIVLSGLALGIVLAMVAIAGNLPGILLVVLSAMAGASAGLAAARSTDRWRPFWLTGVAGGLSTLSALGVDVERMLDDGRPLVAVGYVTASVAGGLTAVRLAGGRR